MSVTEHLPPPHKITQSFDVFEYNNGAVGKTTTFTDLDEAKELWEESPTHVLAVRTMALYVAPDMQEILTREEAIIVTSN